MVEDKGRHVAFDGYTVRADAQGRGPRQIKERPAPPAPIMSKPTTTAATSSEEKSTDLNKSLHRLERFWTDQILYRL